MARQVYWQMSAALAAAILVAGCQPGAQSGSASAPAGSVQRAAATEERDVEAPEIFSVTDKGLWDGRPSLGGIWVAHGSVKDPERAIIRNTATGASVVGALFRRERDNPGPSLQVSSDAAAALDMLAGQPVQLSVIALRREEVAPEPELTPEPAVVAAAPAADAAAKATPSVKPETTASGEFSGTGVQTEVAGGEVAGVSATAADVSPPAKKPGLFAGLFGKKKKPAADASASAIEQTTLDPVVGGAAAALDRVENAAPAAAATPAAPAQAAAAPSTPATRAYLQIGIFSKEENAARAAEQMKAAGLSATIKPTKSQDKEYWRVIVGPVATVAERDAMKAKIKGLGYAEAYPVSK